MTYRLDGATAVSDGDVLPWLRGAVADVVDVEGSDLGTEGDEDVDNRGDGRDGSQGGHAVVGKNMNSPLVSTQKECENIQLTKRWRTKSGAAGW